MNFIVMALHQIYNFKNTTKIIQNLNISKKNNAEK